MKIAIIGAGLAGLSCAHELERLGIFPVIYERNSFIGEQVPHVSVLLQVFTRPINDPLVYINDTLNIKIQPLNTVNRIIHHSSNNRFIAKGNLGYFFIRGKEDNALKNQIYSSIKKSKILFNQNPNYKDLQKKFDYVIIATGDPYITNQLGCWQQIFRGTIRGSIVTGKFDPHAIIMWINKNYCKSGYAYLCPYNENKAFIGLIAPNTTQNEIAEYFENFLYAENIKYSIIEQFNFEHTSGYAYPLKIDNLLFIGNSAGAVDPFLGFGQFNSILTGIMAARSIIQDKSYETLIKSMREINTYMHSLRKLFDNLDNKDYDNLLWSLNLPIIKQSIYRSPLKILKYSSLMLNKSSKIK